MVEQPFTLYIGEGLALERRIDAIIERVDGVWEVVRLQDWRAGPDPLQLAIYGRAVEEIWERGSRSSWLLAP